MAKKRRARNPDLYPNSPLLEVAFEVRFAGEPSVEARRHEFFEKIRKDYPDVFVPNPHEGVAPALQSYRFRQEEAGAQVLIAINSFSFVHSNYRGHAQLISEAIRLYQLLTSTVTIERITRVGWRYVNAIPFSREGGEIPLNRFLREAPVVLPGSRSGFKKINLRASTSYKDVDAAIRLESALHEDNENEVLIFDIDVFKMFDKSDKQPNVNRMANHLHEVGREIFEDSITEPYRQYLKGDAYE